MVNGITRFVRERVDFVRVNYARLHSGTYAHPMNDLTTAFAVPKSGGNARAEDVSKHSAVSRGVIAECSCEVVGRSVR